MCLRTENQRALKVPADKPLYGFRAFGGFRAFRYKDPYELRGTFYNTGNPWRYKEDGIHRSSKLPRINNWSNVNFPTMNRTGLYVLPTIKSVVQNFGGRLVGFVSFWGRVVEHSNGWRAEFAHIEALCSRLLAHADIYPELVMEKYEYQFPVFDRMTDLGAYAKQIIKERR